MRSTLGSLGSENAPGRVPVSGRSMWPAIHPGDEVLFQRAGAAGEAGDLIVGDLIVFKSPSGLCVHRVVFTSETMIQTQGDNCPRRDPPVARSAILGKVVDVQRSGASLSTQRWQIEPSTLRRAWVWARAQAARVLVFR